MKLKKINKALLINQAIKKANIDVSNLSPNTTVNLVDGVLILDKPKKCFISAKNENETPLEKCKRLYYEGVEFEVYSSNRIQTIPNDFRIDIEYGDIILYLTAQKYTLYSKSFDSYVKII